MGDRGGHAMTWLRGDWMQTHTGRRFYPLDPRASEVDPEDIAHALSLLCRYGGHVDRFYSVAEHCVLMSQAVAPEHALAALLHDATEAYVVDVPRPLKINLPDYQQAEAGVELAVWERFGLPMRAGADRVFRPEVSPLVKEADTRILLDERAALMAATVHAWGIDSLAPLDVEVEGWLPARAEQEYLNRLEELGALR
jgi:5'-deoxynucleotidase YfbR-like HD superfamily hydrolase